MAFIAFIGPMATKFVFGLPAEDVVGQNSCSQTPWKNKESTFGCNHQTSNQQHNWYPKCMHQVPGLSLHQNLSTSMMLVIAYVLFAADCCV